MSKLIVGCGYLGGRVARRWLANGHTVWAVTRSPARASEFEEAGLRPIVAAVTRPETLKELPATRTVLYAVSYDGSPSTTRQAVYVGGLRAILNSLSPTVDRVIFTSSTGVYGQTDGSWVSEESVCRPTRDGGRVMLQAEEVLRSHRLEDRAIILRLAGLYGPNRIPRMADLVAERPVRAHPSGHLNLIHVDDAVEAIIAAESRANPPRTYLVSDGNPVQRRAFYEHLAELLGKPVPQFAESSRDPAKQRGMNDKRADNGRMLAELGVALGYPTYREGLSRIAG